VGDISNTSSTLGLYVYGRFDTKSTQLENAIIVEGRREKLRLVSVEALLNLLELKQEYNLEHGTILDLLKPSPVRVDSLVNLISDVVAQEQDDEVLREDVSDNEPDKNPPAAGPAKRVEEPHQFEVTHKLLSVDYDFTGKPPSVVRVMGSRFEVNKWKDAALAVFKTLNRKDPIKFAAAAVTIHGRKRPYFTTNEQLLRQPSAIPDTDLFFEANLSANGLVKLCFTILDRLGIPKDQLEFESVN
jgi:hypothetical protein